MTKQELKDSVADIVKTNGTGEITGANLQAKLFEIIDECYTNGGIESIVAGDNITIDNTDPLNPVINAENNLFPNGVKLVLSSRDFQADDKDFVLYCPVPSTIITMPTTNPFSEGDYIGVVMSSPDSYFETYNNGSGGTDKMYPFTVNPTGTTLEQQSSSEVVILRALNQGTLWILPLCGAVKTSVDINGSNFKTLSKYNYDKSQIIPTTTADISDSTDRRYVTDAELIVIGNTSGTNTGDDAVNSLYSGLVSNATHTGEVTGATGLTLDKTAITNKTTVTVANDDYVLISDTSDSGNLKKALKSDFGGGGSSSLSGLTNATTANTINNSEFLQEWQWNSLTSGNGLKLSSSSTGASGDSQSILLIQQTGINAASQTTFSAIISNTKTGATSKSVALKLLNNGTGENLRMQSTTSLVQNYLTYYNSSDTLTAEIGHTNFAAPTFFYINSYLQSIIFKVVDIERFRLGSNGVNTSANYIDVTSPNFISYSGTGRFFSTNGDEYSFQANNAGSSAFFGALSGNRGCLRTTGGQAIIWNNNQQVSINQNTVNTSAQFQVDSVTRGVLLPRMTTTQKNAIASPAEGLEVYDSTLKKKCFYNGTVWETITSI